MLRSIANNLILNWKKSFFKYILIVFPIFVQFWYMCKYALNIPRYDDYDSILELVVNFKRSPFPQNIYHLFDQHIEHRIFATRGVSVLYYLIFGNIDFRAIIFFNFFLALLFFFAMLYFIKRAIPRYWHYAAIVLSMCVFDIINTENCNWAMSGIQNYGVNLFFVGSMILYSLNKNKYLVPAFLLQVLCIYTSGNGHVGSLFIAGYNILSGNKKNATVSLIAMFVFSPLYYYHYHSAGSTFTAEMSKVVPFFLHVAGSHFSFDYGIPIGVLMLIAFFSLFGRELKRLPKSDPRILPLLCIAGYALSSQIIMSFFRGGLPVVVSYSSRYLIYSSIILILSFTILLFRIENDDLKILISDVRHTYRLPIITLSIILCSVSYLFNYDDGKKSYEGMYHILTTERYFFPDSVRAKRITDDACDLGIYCMDKVRAKIPVQ